MKKIILTPFMLSSALLATPEVNNLAEVFTEAKTSGNVRYYYIQTDKDYENATDTSAYANSVGGKLKYSTASLYGFHAGVTFMTTNPFLLGSNTDTSIIGKDNGARGGDAKEGFSVLGEAYLAYDYKTLSFLLGRNVIKTPFVNAKEVRMLPSSVEGAFASYKPVEGAKVQLAYLNKFKQRTSSVFTNIVEHALGTNTTAVTGSSKGFVLMAGVDYKNDALNARVYEYYCQNFLNSIYFDASYKFKLSKVNLTFAGQYMNQNSIGNADTNLAKTASLTGGKAIQANAFGLKAIAQIKGSTFTLAYTNVLRDEKSHDSLVLAWDGTPLYSNMITSNNLFQSIYGNALKADSIYIGGSRGLKVAYNQKFDFLGLDGFDTTLSYLNTQNSRAGFDKAHQDYNVVLGYKANKAFSLALKGIWVQNNTNTDTKGTVSQLKLLTQYRVIVNYAF